MKLSEAMRRGSKMCKHAVGRWAGNDGSGCAIATLMMGAGIIKKTEHSVIFMSDTFEQFPMLLRPVACPVCTIHGARSLYEIIMHLNDDHKFTRERISGWIEAHMEVPVYSMLEMQQFMEDSEKAEVPCV